MPFKDPSRYQSEEWKEYQRNYQRDWHQRNKERRLANLYEQKAARKTAIHEYIKNMKKQLYCADCGQQHSATLHFHHKNPEEKVFNISEAAYMGLSLDRIKKEIEKCIILCANCHFIRHYNMRNQQQTKLGLAEDIENINTLLPASPEEEVVYNRQSVKNDILEE